MRATASVGLAVVAALAAVASVGVRVEQAASRAADPAPATDSALAAREPVVARAPYIAPSGPSEPPARMDPAVARRAPKIRGLRLPISGAAIPTDPLLLPGSDRAYRAGIHEGIDLAAPLGTPVHAAADGVVVRIDGEYVEAPLATRNAALATALQLGHTPEKALDLVRGRQVWIDHGNGIATRYCHLSSVAPLLLGATVRAGDVIGAVGSSGLPENGPHLHFEVRIGEGFLGDGLSGADLVRAIDLAFR